MRIRMLLLTGLLLATTPVPALADMVLNKVVIDFPGDKVSRDDIRIQQPEANHNRPKAFTGILLNTKCDRHIAPGRGMQFQQQVANWLILKHTH